MCGAAAGSLFGAAALISGGFFFEKVGDRRPPPRRAARRVCSRGGVGQAARMQWLHDAPISTLALLSRLFVLSFTILCGALGAPYDTSWPLLPSAAPAETRPLDAAVLALLAPLARWDGVYYLHLASPWVSYGDGENLHAFLPGFPAALRCARALLLRPLEAAGLLSPRPALLLGGVLLNLACVVVAAVA